MREQLFKDFERDAYGDGNVYRGVRSNDSTVKTVWVGLTDADLNGLARWADEHGGTFHTAYGKAIEAKLREKNFER
jgi:hypothetical protein